MGNEWEKDLKKSMNSQIQKQTQICQKQLDLTDLPGKAANVDFTFEFSL